jgi:hypothetical protein
VTVPVLNPRGPPGPASPPAQVANYPSQLVDPGALGPHHMRKKAHTDSGLLTLLASEDWMPGSGWAPGDGGLQLLNADGEWVEVAVPEGARRRAGECAREAGGDGAWRCC